MATHQHPTETTPVLAIEGLNISYRTAAGTKRVVHDVGFSIGAGEVVAMVGESGSGKTTTAQAVIGLLPGNGAIESGRIALNGEDIAGWSGKRMQPVRGSSIGLIPQDPGVSLNPTRTIGSQVGEIFTIHKRLRGPAVNRRVIELLEHVGLSEPERLAKQYPHQLSGGMRQRVLIASAIALQPRLIIADEATSALDVTVQAKVLDLLEDLRAEHGTSILFVTHDLAVASDRASRIVVMRNGRIEEQGTAHGVLTNPQNDYTRKLISDAPTFSTVLRRPGPGADQQGTTPAITVTDLVKEFTSSSGPEPFKAVDGVSFSVPPGTTHSIVGESGSGKTTTARMIVRFERPTSGTIRLGGKDITSVSGEEMRQLRRNIQLVYQNPYASMDPRQSIADAVQEPMRAFRIGDKHSRSRAVADLIDRVALPSSVLVKKPRELSGGQLQRVAIARALAVQPDVVVLDEAVSALDVTVQAQILRLLDQLQRDLGLTYLFISHDLAVVRQISDTVSVMSRGKVVESGAIGEVFENAKHHYTRELLAAIPGQGVLAA